MLTKDKVELTEWESKHFFSIPTGKKRIRLGLLQYKHLLTGLEDAVGPAFSENKDDKSHVGANVFLSVKRDNPFVDLRQYWKPRLQRTNKERLVHASLGI